MRKEEGLIEEIEEIGSGANRLKMTIKIEKLERELIKYF